MPRKSLATLLHSDVATLPVVDQLRLAFGMLRAMGVRQPCWRVYKRELPLCGARCRDGHLCQAKAAWDEDRCAPRNGRCRLQGGLSAGPKTPEGRRRVGAAARQRAQARRQRHMCDQALAAYTLALQAYEAQRQVSATRRHRLDAGMLVVKWRQVELAYWQCLDCGVDPTRR